MIRSLFVGRPFRAGLGILALMASAAGVASAQGKILLYVPDNVNNKMDEFGLDTTTGNPVAVPPQAANNGPWDIAVTPNNKFMYVGDNSGFIDGFVVDSNGATTAIPAAITGAGSVFGIAIDPTGKFLYASDATGARIVEFSIDQTTGQLTAIGSVAVTNPRGLAVDQNNHLYAALSSTQNAVAAFAINPNGSLTALGTTSTGSLTPSGTTNRVAVNPAGTFLYSTNSTDSSISIFPITGTGALGAATRFALTPGVGPFGITVHPNGTILLVTDFLSGAVYSFTISGGSLTAAAGSPFAVGTSPAGVTVDPSGRFAYIANSGSASITKYSINTSTGVLSGASTTSLASGAAPYFLLSRPAPFSAATVPTLSAWGLLLLGMLLAGSSAFLYKRAYR